MSEEAAYVPELPEHPELQEIALVIERAGMMAEILDARFRCVFVSTETARGLGASAAEADGLAYIPLAELDGVSDKAVRDAGAIPVTAI